MAADASSSEPTRWQRLRAHLAACWSPRPALRSLAPSLAHGGASGGRFEALDGVRCIALFWVLIFHVAVGPAIEEDLVDAVDTPTASIASRWMRSIPAQFVINGGQGVDVFFALSGFLIAHLYISEVSREGSFRCGLFFLYRWAWSQVPSADSRA